LRALFGPAYARGFAIRLWDGTIVPAQDRAEFTLAVNDASALRGAFAPPAELSAGRAFTAGLLDVEGDAESAVDAMLRAMQTLDRRRLAKVWYLLRRLPRAPLPPLREARLRGRRHSIARDRAAIGFHYDQPVEFYRAFLDRDLVYSCAYFDEGIESIDDAQRAKLDYTLKKLRLAPGERLLDIGCGWGALLIRAALGFGARVLGVTLSERQYEEARRRIHEAGLEDRARVERWDYRELPRAPFDKIVSVGMFEHVGRKRFAEYFETAYRLLRPGGLFLNHAIGLGHASAEHGEATGFMAHFIFPDGELVPIGEALHSAERAGFEVRDVENLREHYRRTLRAWLANLERNKARAVEAAGLQTYQAWRLYMAGSAQGFRTGRIAVYQSLLAKPGPEGIAEVPPTRRDLYA
jgi:cyclopropane-fatty-acyl-phospholipid synthase